MTMKSNDNYVPAGVHLKFDSATWYYREAVGSGRQILCLTGMSRHIELPTPAPRKMVMQFTTKPRKDSFEIIGWHVDRIRVKDVPVVLTHAMDQELALQRANGRKFFHFEYE
jgi:hypothetical protein